MHCLPWRRLVAIAQHNLWLVALSSFTSTLIAAIATPTRAAERIHFQYGLLSVSITRHDLETFTETGEASGSLRQILARLGPEAREQFRGALQARYDIDPVLVNRFSYTSPGTQVLQEVGDLVQTESGQNGFYALRASLTLAATDPGGLTLLNVLQKFPTNIRVDVSRALAIDNDLNTLLTQTQQAMEQLAKDTDAIATTEPTIDFTTLPDPRQIGEWQPSVQTLQLHDPGRDRTIALDLYLPDIEERQKAKRRQKAKGRRQKSKNTPAPTSPTTHHLPNSYRDASHFSNAERHTNTNHQPLTINHQPHPKSKIQNPKFPIILISNGLGAHRSRFDELALHLASHGFAVAMLDHPGSDRQRLQEFYQGLHTENFDATEYIDRPLDVSFVLDELTRMNAEHFGDRLNPNQAGVFGYSFGGTTALALAGAEMDRDHLQQECDRRTSLFNISLLYQCRALELPIESPDLHDPRIQAVYVFVPFSSAIYGPQGMAKVEGPVFWEATEQDILTPLVMEQLPAFSWLAQDAGMGNRYLAVTEGLPHARLTLDVINRLTNQAIAWEDIKPITETYHQMLTTAFFQVHLAQNNGYRPYLQARGMQYLTQEPYRLNWSNGESFMARDSSP